MAEISRVLLYGDSYRNPNLFLASGFLAPDPIIYLESDRAKVLAVPPMEQSRAKSESSVKEIRNFDDLGFQEAVDRTGSRFEAMTDVIANLLAESGGGPVAVEANFPLLLADGLRARGVELHPDARVFTDQRRRKSPQAEEAMARAQARAEAAIAEVRQILAESEIIGDSIVYRGVPLTAERLRSVIEVGFARDGYVSQSSIVAPGHRSSDPHWEGSGPVSPNEPLILDLFPQSKSSRYHADITRTFVKGTPSDMLLRMFESVKKAHHVALDLIRPDANGRDIHKAVQASFQADGFSDEGPYEARYTHGTGHGLGLEVHEQPSMGKIDMELRPGDVVTVEPGLYDPAIGGVRLEDVVFITEDGYRNFNKLPKELVIK